MNIIKKRCSDYLKIFQAFTHLWILFPLIVYLLATYILPLPPLFLVPAFTEVADIEGEGLFFLAFAFFLAGAVLFLTGAFLFLAKIILSQSKRSHGFSTECSSAACSESTKP